MGSGGITVTGSGGAGDPYRISGGGGDSVFFYPEQFGAVGDGEADDTDAIQEAIDAAYEFGGGTVILSQRYGWRGDIFHRGAVTVRGTAAQKVLITEDHMDRGLIALNDTARYLYGKWAGGSAEDNPGGIYDLNIDGGGVGGVTDGLFIMQCVDGYIGNCRIVHSGGNAVYVDGAQNTLFSGGVIGYSDGNAIEFDLTGGGQSAGNVKFDGTYVGTSRILLHSTTPPGVIWPHDIIFDKCLFENYTAGNDLIYLEAGGFQFSNCVFTNSNSGSPLPPNECLVLIEQDIWPTIPTQASFDSCYFIGGGTKLPHLIRAVTDVSVPQIGNFIRLYGATYLTKAFYAVGIDGGAQFSSAVTFDGDVFKVAVDDWYEAIGDAWLHNIQLRSATPRRWEMPDDPGGFLPDPIVTKREDDTQDRFRISRDGILRWGDGADATIGTALVLPDDVNNRMILGGSWRFNNSLELRGLLQTIAGVGVAAPLSAAPNAAPAHTLYFSVNGATADITIDSSGNVGAILVVWLLGTGTNTANWSSAFHFTGTPLQPTNGAYQSVAFQKQLDGGWHELFRSGGGGGGGGTDTHGQEIAYAERTSNFTTTNTTAGNAAGIITGLSISVLGTGDAVDIEFQALTTHSVASTIVTAALIEDSVNTAFYGASSSPSTSLCNTLYFKRRLIIANGVTKTYQVALSGAVAGTVTSLTTSGTTPITLSATRR